MSAPSSTREIFAYKDNIPSQVGDEKRKQPVKPRSAFMCFTDAKKKELLERNGLPPKKADVLALAASEYQKLSDKERAFWDEEEREDKRRFVREMKQFKGELVMPKRRSKKHPDAPKRAMSAFLKYSKTLRAKVKKDNPNLENTDISRLLGEMWKNASETERAPYIQGELREREAYKESMKTWREKEAKIAAASRTSHRAVQEVHRTHHDIGYHYDEYPHIHSVEEAVQKLDHDATEFRTEDSRNSFQHRHAQSGAFKSGYYGGYHSQANEIRRYRPHSDYPLPSSRGPYPFRLYAPLLIAHRGSGGSESPPEQKMEETDEHHPTSSPYFDHAGQSPFGFYQYP